MTFSTYLHLQVDIAKFVIVIVKFTTTFKYYNHILILERIIEVGIEIIVIANNPSMMC